MRLTPLRNPPARPLTHSGGSGRHGKKKEEQEQEQEQKQHFGLYRGRIPPRRRGIGPLPHFDLTDVSTKVDTYQEPPVPTVTGKLSGVGRSLAEHPPLRSPGMARRYP